MYTSFKYRRIIAHILNVWMWLIITSGAVFMHKEVTSDGIIVTHTHPYDFTNKSKKHHKSDEEIHFLDIVFQGAFVKASIFLYESPIRLEYSVIPFQEIQELYSCKTTTKPCLRGPPSYKS